MSTEGPKAPRGTQDWLPGRVEHVRRVDDAVRSVCARYGYREISTPIFESVSLFARGLGETTDIVEKQMFTFRTSEEGETFALRPEMTAATVRAFLEHSLHKQRGFHKLFYIGPAFRHERVQRGRFRQFRQFGIEAFGSADPMLDAEGPRLFADILAVLGIAGWALKVNTIGCPACRPAFREALKAAAAPHLAQYCENCRRRADRNPLRILDCKEERCVALSATLPRLEERQCADCRAHFDSFRRSLDALGMAHAVEPRLVRGLDYYTRTVYEFTAAGLGAQDAVAGGGRYDGLVEEMGGPPTPAVGFAAGVERIVLLLEQAGAAPEPRLDAYVVTVRPDERAGAFGLLHRLRAAGMSADMNYEGRSLKAQFRDANARGARFVLIVGPDEWARGCVKVKDLAGGGEEEVAADAAAERLRRKA